MAQKKLLKEKLKRKKLKNLPLKNFQNPAQKKGLLRGNGAASNDCLPYEKVKKIFFAVYLPYIFTAFIKIVFENSL